jgi:hypothetical protein
VPFFPFIASAQPKTAWQLKLARYFAGQERVRGGDFPLGLSLLGQSFPVFALDCCAGERSIFALGQ